MIRILRRSGALLFLLALAGPVPAQGGPAPGLAARNEAAPRAFSPKIFAAERLRQGDPIVAWVASPGPLNGAELSLVSSSGRRFSYAPLFEDQAAAPRLPGRPDLPPAFSFYGAVLAVPIDLEPGAYRLELGHARGIAGAGAAASGAAAAPGATSLAAVDLAIDRREFPLEDIPLDGANTALRTLPDPKKDEESRRLAELLGRADADALFLDDQGFGTAVGSWPRSSGFGDRRRYLYSGGGSDQAVHAGVDIAVPAGTPVLAPAAGRVVFAAERIVTGRTIVLEHLPGLFTILMHLETLEVAEGDLVIKGMRVAASGSTGMSTGPHLHLEMRARGAAVDPDWFLSSPPLDTGRIMATMSELIEGR